MLPTNNGPTTPSGEWPAVPPAPAPIRPAVALAPPDPWGSDRGVPSSPVLITTAAASGRAGTDDEPPTMAIETGALPLAPTRPVRTARTRLFRPDTSPVAVLQESARRRLARATDIRRDVVWQPRFAYGSAAIILLALTVMSLPLWIVLWRITGAPATKPADVIAICMMLMGGFLTAAALWAIVIEMRGRFRMVDALARSGDQALFAPGDPEPADPSPLDRGALDRAPEPAPYAARAFPALTTAQLTIPPLPLTGNPHHPVPATMPGHVASAVPSHVPPHIAARAEAEQANAAAMLDASGRLLASFSSVLRSFGQLPAQVATLAVALVLFVGATILSLH